MVGTRNRTFRAYHSPGPTFGGILNFRAYSSANRFGKFKILSKHNENEEPRFRIRKVRLKRATRSRRSYPPIREARSYAAGTKGCLRNAGELLWESVAKRAPMPPARKARLRDARRLLRRPAARLARRPAPPERRACLRDAGGRRGNRSALRLMRRPQRRPAARLARRPILPGRRACLLWW